MAVSPQRCSLTWRDAKGNTARTLFYVDGQVSATAAATAQDAIKTTIAALTNAVFQSAIGPKFYAPQPVVYGTNSVYATIEDKAVFTFQTSDGTIVRTQVAAPKSTIFLADGETVDPANTDVVAYVAAIIANTVTREAKPIAFGAFGIRRRVPIRRRLNIFLKNPALTGPDE